MRGLDGEKDQKVALSGFVGTEGGPFVAIENSAAAARGKRRAGRDKGEAAAGTREEPLNGGRIGSMRSGLVVVGVGERRGRMMIRAIARAIVQRWAGEASQVSTPCARRKTHVARAKAMKTTTTMLIQVRRVVAGMLPTASVKPKAFLSRTAGLARVKWPVRVAPLPCATRSS